MFMERTSLGLPTNWESPWSVICFLESAASENFWFASGTSPFAVAKVQQEGWTVCDLQSDIVAGSELKNVWDPSEIDLVPLLYQTGYLTIDRQDPVTKNYFLRIPDLEVEQSLVDHLLVASSDSSATDFQELRQKFKDCLQMNDLKGLFSTSNTLLASTSYRLHTSEEKYYHSLLHMSLLSLGFPVEAEVETSQGRIDMVVDLPERLFIFEFKMDRSAKAALRQIRSGGYVQKYRNFTKPVELVGVRFSSKTRGVEDWEHEQL